MSNQDAVKKYQEKRDSIMLRPSKEDGKRIRQVAKEENMSVQAFMMMLFNDFLERTGRNV